jgi:NifU-like protein involved in Fe-S cluster formation
LRKIEEDEKKWYIKDWSYNGNTSMITTAASSFLSELIVGKSIDECLVMTYENTLLPE